jgi:hypothetical protein
MTLIIGLEDDLLNASSLASESQAVHYGSLAPSAMGDKPINKTSGRSRNGNESSASEGPLLPFRIFELNKTTINSRLYCGNQIRTSKYTVITFLPKNLID